MSKISYPSLYSLIFLTDFAIFYLASNTLKSLNLLQTFSKGLYSGVIGFIILVNFYYVFLLLPFYTFLFSDFYKLIKLLNILSPTYFVLGFDFSSIDLFINLFIFFYFLKSLTFYKIILINLYSIVVLILKCNVLSFIFYSIIYLNTFNVNFLGPLPILLGNNKYSKHYFFLLYTTSFNKLNACNASYIF